MGSVIKITSAIALAAACSVLVGCGGAPSESDIKAAVEKQVKAERDAMERISGKQAMEMMKGMFPEIKSVHKIGCKEDGEKAYKCDVEVEVVQGNQTGKNAAVLRFVKGSDGWIAQK